jgi:MFS family permease
MTETAELPRSFWRFLTASAVSTTGDGIRFAALPLLSAMLLQSPIQVATVTAISTLPWLLLGLPAGVLVDRARRVRLMIVADLVRAAALVGLVVGLAAGHVSFLVLLVVAAILGVGEVVFDLAGFAVLPGLVHHDLLERANGRLFAVQTGARDILGHLVGGVLIVVGRLWPFFVDALSFLVSAVLLRKVPELPVEARQRRRLTAEIREGVGYLVRDRVLRSLAVTAGVVNAVYLGQIAVLPLFALGPLHMPAAWYGTLLAASSLGGIIGGWLADRATRRFRRNATLVSGLTLLAAQSLLVGLWPHRVVALVGFFLAGAAMMAWNVVAVSIRQASVPAALLGRVGSVYRLISWGTMPFGGVVAGVLAARFGPGSAFVLGGLVVAVAAALLAVVLSRDVPERTASEVTSG